MRTTPTFRVYDGYLCYHSKYAGAMRTLRLIEVATNKDVTGMNGSPQMINKAKRELERYNALPPKPVKVSHD